ncbi:MAG: glycosyltransferase family 39 protein [Chloroflexi bacterium]|nr:glycosyltransferase family 39 protein [Chloroflexota bacterium]
MSSYVRPFVLPARLLPGIQIVIGVAILIALAVPLLTAEGGPLTSGESLYVSEALNLAEGKGFTYATGERVHDRGPLYPTLLAADFSIAGYSLDHARWVTKLFALGSAALLLGIGWRLFGREAGFLAAAAALASSLLNTMGSSLLPDSAQTFFLLLTLLCLYPAFKEAKPEWAGASGAALGLAMLTKESALLWLPLPFLAVLLLGPAVSRPKTLLAAYTLGFLAVAGWWWPYVYAVTGQVYLLGDPSGAAVWLAAGTACMTCAILAAIVYTRRDAARASHTRVRWLAAGTILIAWGALFIVGLEKNAAWPSSTAYLYNVPAYTTSVLASWVQPLPLIAVAWGYIAYRAWRGSLGDRLLLLALLLFLPFALFAANRALSVGDLLPLAYLSYLALGRSAFDFARWLAELTSDSLSTTVSGAVAAVLVLAAFGWFVMEESQRFSDQQQAFEASTISQEHWDNPLARQTAAWVKENVPPGTPIMSGRLYSTHLYTLTDGRYPWWQLPTVRVDFEGSPLSAVRASTLFRWEDHRIPEGAAEPWLYVRREAERGYYVALSEIDLLTELAENRIRYLILTGDDAGFSSLSLLPYFEKHPYFQKAKSFTFDARNQVHIFEVLPGFEQPVAPPTLVNGATDEALRAELGNKKAQELLDGLSPGGYAISAAYAAVRPPAADREPSHEQ